ncbi:MAG: GNAT family N-acetyltransferase [Labilithrix sp.]
MRTLILGGTGFIGRHLVDALVAAGHEVTLFHRGLSAGGRAAGVREVIGDRTRDLGALDPRGFDLVIDTSGYEVEPVRAALRRLREVPRWVYLSTISVYRDLHAMEESAPLKEDEAAEAAPLGLESYGPLKVACERAVREERGERALVLRLGRTVGPHDSDERVPWLLRRVAQGGWLIGPGDPDAVAQLADARDVAAFAVRAAPRLTGTLNVVGDPIPMRTLYATMIAETQSDARVVWVDDEALLKQGVRPFSGQPFWLPRSLGYVAVTSAAAREAGFATRPLAETIRDTWRWLETGWDADADARTHRRLDVPAGIPPERERAVLRDAVRLRAYEPRDEAAVVALVKSVLGEYGFTAEVGGLEGDLRALETRYRDGRFWVAELGGEIIGTVAIRPKDEGRCELKRLYLRPDARGLGLGQRLYEEAEAFARAVGYAKLWLDSSRRFTSAHRLYERNGFVLVERLDNDWEDNVYEKSLEEPKAP